MVKNDELRLHKSFPVLNSDIIMPCIMFRNLEKRSLEMHTGIRLLSALKNLSVCSNEVCYSSRGHFAITTNVFPVSYDIRFYENIAGFIVYIKTGTLTF